MNINQSSSPTVIALLAAKAKCETLELISKKGRKELYVARANVTLRAIDAVVAGESAAVSCIIVLCDESVRLGRAIKKAGLNQKYFNDIKAARLAK